MLLSRFPDIKMVKRLRNNATSPADAWKNVALNIKCKYVSRTGIESLYSLFVNNKGHSFCEVNRQHYRIEPDNFLLTRPGDIYGLTIDNISATEICNIHINRDFFTAAAQALVTASAALLDNPFPDNAIEPVLLSQLYHKDKAIALLIAQFCSLQLDDETAFELILSEIINVLLLAVNDNRRKIAMLPGIKTSVKVELYKRLSYARDYMATHYNNAPDLDTICREIGMSKFHFLRLFKACFGETPYHYLGKLRMEKAVILLRSTDDPINAIADNLGFEFPNSFIRAFQKAYGKAPLQFRKAMR